MSRPRRLSLNPAHFLNGATLDPTPPPTPGLLSPESTVSRVLTRLHAQHPTLAAPTVAETHSFLEKAAQVPDLPEWIWYGMLHFAVEQDDDGGERETVDFGILDEVLDADIVERGRGGRVLDMLFFYMYLCLEPGRSHEEKGDWENKEEREEPTQEEEEEVMAVGTEELGRRTEELKTEGVVTPPATEDGSGSEGERTARRRKGKGSVSQKSEELQELQTHHQEQQEHRDQQKSAGGLDIKSIIIFFLLIAIGLLLVFPPSEDAFAHVRWVSSPFDLLNGSTNTTEDGCANKPTSVLWRHSRRRTRMPRRRSRKPMECIVRKAVKGLWIWWWIT